MFVDGASRSIQGGVLKRMTCFLQISHRHIVHVTISNFAAAAATLSKSQDRTCCGEAKTTSIAAAWRGARAWNLNLGFSTYSHKE